MIQSGLNFDTFKTRFYEGAWIPFNGDRAFFRSQVQMFLRARLLDHQGELRVTDQGPQWNGNVKLNGLSYSHSFDWGVLLFSRSVRLGVDLEKKNRILRQDPCKLADRFFHPSESEYLKSIDPLRAKSEFLRIWMFKEAYSKSRGEHLVQWIDCEVLNLAHFESLSKTREGYEAWVAVHPLEDLEIPVL